MEKVASLQGAVNMIVPNDIWRLNAIPDAKYGVFGWTQGVHMGSADGDLINFAFTLFYIDRLTSDKSNQVEVQSVGIQVLDTIIRTLDEQGIFTGATYNFQTFNQRFSDECAGVMCNVTFQVPVTTICGEQPEGDTHYLLTSEGWKVVTADGFNFLVRE